MYVSFHFKGSIFGNRDLPQWCSEQNVLASDLDLFALGSVRIRRSASLADGISLSSFPGCVLVNSESKPALKRRRFTRCASTSSQEVSLVILEPSVAFHVSGLSGVVEISVDPWRV
jgi:hypothetical protein